MPEPLSDAQLAKLRTELGQLPDVQSTMQMLLRQLQMQSAVPKLLDEIERQRAEIERLREENANWRANVTEYRQIHNRAWHLIDGLAEDLGDHSPIAHPEYVERAETFLAMYPRHQYPVE